VTEAPAAAAGRSNAPVLAEVVRNGFVESRHRGSLVALDAAGDVAFAHGELSQPVFPRSANKPVQVVAMVRAGLDLPDELLALASASHGGEAFHLDGVRRILAGAGLDETALQTPAELPLDEPARQAYLRSGQPATPLAMNCSGKHAAMLATCVALGWPVRSYLDPDHPLQRLTRDTLEELAGEPVKATGVDGCGAPLFAVTLTGLALAFRTLALAGDGSAERRVADAVRGYPRWVGGARSEDTLLMEAVPGLLAKRGAEGVLGLALADGRALALKFEDGTQRARLPVTVRALQLLGVDSPGLATLGAAPVLGGGVPVGEVRAVLP
jgi:L-asparaginase II